jgi:hypothetical protein
MQEKFHDDFFEQEKNKFITTWSATVFQLNTTRKKKDS